MDCDLRGRSLWQPVQLTEAKLHQKFIFQGQIVDYNQQKE